jgi:hypothetical protein
LQYIKSVLKENLGASVVVTRNKNKAVRSEDLPSVHIVDQGERVLEQPSGPIVKKRMNIMLTSTFRGSTEEKAPMELAEFQRDVVKALYGQDLSQTVGTTYKGSLYEIQSSEIYVPDEGSPNVVSQHIEFEVLYLQDRRLLFS